MKILFYKNSYCYYSICLIAFVQIVDSIFLGHSENNINETSNVTSSTKWNRRMSRDLNYNDRYLGDDVSYVSKFQIEILPDSQLIKNEDGNIFIRFRIRQLNYQSDGVSRVFAYNLEANPVELVPNEGYNDAIYLLPIHLGTNSAMFNNKIVLVAFSNDWITTRIIIIRNHDIHFDDINNNMYKNESDIKIDYTIQNSCKNSWYGNCHDAKWSFRFSVVDYRNCILEVTSNPYTLNTVDSFISGTNEPIFGYSSVSCCVQNVELIALNGIGRVATQVINAYESQYTIIDILAITLGVIILLIIIASIITFIIYKRKRARSTDLPTYRSS